MVPTNTDPHERFASRPAARKSRCRQGGFQGDAARNPDDSPFIEWFAASVVTCGWAVLVVTQVFVG